MNHTRPTLRPRRLAAGFLVVAALATTTAGLSTPAAAHARREIEQIAALDPSSAEFPEGIVATDDGSLYVNLVARGDVLRLDPAGTITTLAHVPLSTETPEFLIALAPIPDGSGLYATVGGPAGPKTHQGVWRIGFDGSAQLWAPFPSEAFPDEMALGPDGRLYVADLTGAVWQVEPDGTPSPWVRSPLLEGFPEPERVPFPVGANGLVFDRHGEALFATNTNRGTIVRIPYHEGHPGEPGVFASDPALHGANGVVMDRRGVLITANSFDDSLVAIDRRGRIEVLAQGGLLARPANVAWGAHPEEADQLYVTSSDFARRAHPGVQRIELHPGG